MQHHRAHYGKLTMSKKRTANTLPCVFLENARQKPHDTFLHGKKYLSCAFRRTHGKCTLPCGI
jgi:hypothetical protein